MSINVCEYCGKVFEAKRKDKKYCCYSCQNKSKYEDSVCLNCGKVFRKGGKDSTCCSIVCAKQYEWKNKQAEGLNFIESSKKFRCRFVETTCKTCGKAIKIRHGDYNRSMREHGYVTCSRKCSSIAKGTTILIKCSECGKEYYRAKSLVQSNIKYYFCSKECQDKNSEYRPSGKDHYNFINGDTSYKRGENWLQVRREVRERDNFTCQICGKTEEEVGKLLDVHHIKPYRLFDNYEEANDLTNLIALCPSCHHKLESEEAKKEREVKILPV